MHCPECGADQRMNSCDELFHQILAMEAKSPAVLAEHFKTVACYNIQHPAQYVDAVIDNLVIALRDNLYNGLSVEDIRKRNRYLYDGPKRVRKPEAERQPKQRSWSMTTGDVWVEGNGDQTAANIIAWAKAVVQDIDGREVK